MNISLVILNWKRENNVISIIDKMINYDCIDEILISNGNKDSNICNIIENKSNKNIKCYNDSYINNIYGLDLRFVTALKARNEYICIIDDDIDINENEFNKLIFEYDKDKNRLVGITGRTNDNGNYICKDFYGEVDIVLTKLVIFKKQLSNLFFLCKPLIESIYKSGIPYGNGEDIFFSFITSIYFNKKNYALQVNYNEYQNQNAAISCLPNHGKYRNNLCKFLFNNKNLIQKFINELNII